MYLELMTKWPNVSVFVSLPQVAAKDKSALQAQVASLHKENLDLNRSKKVLQTKVSPLTYNLNCMPNMVYLMCVGRE